MVLRAMGNEGQSSRKALAEAPGLPEGLIQDRVVMLRSQIEET